MMFKCKHKARYLAVEKDNTIESLDKDFNKVTIHLYCLKCHESVEIVYAKLKAPIGEWLETPIKYSHSFSLSPSQTQ